MRVLVTRPLDDSRRTARRLAELGHEAVIAPLLRIRFPEHSQPELDGVQAVLATSSNGVRALALCSERRDISVFAVGTQTAAAARAAGFLKVFDAAGDATALARAVRTQLRTNLGALVHVMGVNAPQELRADLTSAGFDVRSWALYETIEARRLPVTAAKALREAALDAVLVFSHAARSFLLRSCNRPAWPRRAGSCWRAASASRPRKDLAASPSPPFAWRIIPTRSSARFACRRGGSARPGLMAPSCDSGATCISAGA